MKRLQLCRATAGERQANLPGDELIDQPMAVITHAITIETPAAAVWPWLAQIGSGRAGWYAFDHIDNGGVPSARALVPALQEIAVGDVLPCLPGATDAFVVARLDPGQALILTVPFGIADGPAPALRVSWALVLQPSGVGRTRLISRGRVSRAWLAAEPAREATGQPIFIERVYGLLAKLPPPLLMSVAGAGHYLMESRMLRGIKRRAEHAPETVRTPARLDTAIGEPT